MAIQSFFSLSYCGHAKRKKYREFIVFPSCNLASYIHTYFYKESKKEDITLINLTKILLKDCSNFLKILRLSRRLFNMVSYLTIQWVENNSEGVFLSSCNNFHKIFLDFSQHTIAWMPSLLCRSQISIGAHFGQFLVRKGCVTTAQCGGGAMHHYPLPLLLLLSKIQSKLIYDSLVFNNS